MKFTDLYSFKKKKIVVKLCAAFYNLIKKLICFLKKLIMRNIIWRIITHDLMKENICLQISDTKNNTHFTIYTLQTDVSP